MTERRGNGSSLLHERIGQRIRINEEFVLTGISISEWYWQNSDMADARTYKDPEYRNQRWLREWRKQVGAPEFGYGVLQKQMNATMDNVLDRFRSDMPLAKEKHVYAFSYFVAGFSPFLVAHLLGLDSSRKASALKNLIKKEILMMHSPHKFEYLALLPDQSCRFGKEMLYLQSSIEAYYGKREKDQNQSSAGDEAGGRGARKRVGPHKKGQQTSKIHSPE